MSDIAKRLGFPGAAIGLAIVFAAQATPAGAQDEDQIKDLLACDKIKKAEDKLECFNAVIEILKQQEAARDRDTGSADSDLMRRRSVDSAAPRDDDFGLSAAEIQRREEARNPERAKSPKEQTFTFTRTWQDAAGKYYFLMTNGQVWKETGGSHMTVPKRSNRIRIKRNMFGGYYAFIVGMEAKRGRVKRVR